MNSLINKVAIISLALLFPALFLSTAGILYLAFEMEGANKSLEMCLSNPAGKLLLSPFVVLGGPVLVVILNAWKMCHLSAETINDEFVIALSIKRMIGNLFFVLVGSALILLLLSYTFVENFRIVAR
jgi:hypothetical protein